MNYTFSYACECNDLEFLLWLDELLVSHRDTTLYSGQYTTNILPSAEGNNTLNIIYRNGNLKMLKFVIDRFSVPSSELHRGCYELIMSYIDGNREIIEWLVDSLVTKEEKTSYKNNLIAIVLRHFPEKRNGFSYTILGDKCLEYASNKGNEEIVKILMEYIPFQNHVLLCALEEAVKGCHIGIIALLIDTDCLNKSYLINAVKTACEYSQFNVAEFLIRTCDLSREYKEELTNIIRVVLHRNKDFNIVKLLYITLNLTLKDVCKKDYMGDGYVTEICHLCKHGYYDIFQWLIEKELINKKEYGKEIEEALELLCDKNKFDLVKWAIRALGINVEQDGQTIAICLKRGFLKGNVEFVKWLLKSIIGKSNLTRNEFRQDIIGFFSGACETCQLESLKRFGRMLKLTSNEIRNNGNEALRKALRSGNLTVVKWLMGKFNLGEGDLLMGKCELILTYIDGNMAVVDWVENQIN